MEKTGVLFDLDGVIIDSESSYTEFWSGIDQIYPTGIANYAIAIKGTTLPEIMKHYDDDSVKDDILKRIHDFQESMVYSVYPGVENFLSELNRRNIPAAIVTSSDNRKMEILFCQYPQLKDYFSRIIDASCVSHSKPHPEGYLKAAAALGCKPENCFVFEDSLQGLAAGQASGAIVVALSTTYPAEALKGKAAKVIGGFEKFTVDDMLALRKV